MPAHRQQRRLGVKVPQPDGCVARGGSEAVPVGAKGNTQDGLGVARHRPAASGHGAHAELRLGLVHDRQHGLGGGVGDDAAEPPDDLDGIDEEGVGQGLLVRPQEPVLVRSEQKKRKKKKCKKSDQFNFEKEKKKKKNHPIGKISVPRLRRAGRG